MFSFTKTKRIQDKSIDILNAITLRALKKKRKDFEINKLQKYDKPDRINAEKSKVFVDYFFEGVNENDEPFSEQEIMDEISTLMLGVNIILYF